MSNTLTSTLKIWGEKRIVVFFVLLILSLCLYATVLNKCFSSDDFMVIRRVGLDNQIQIQGFFRPLSDLTLNLTYRLFKLQSFYYLFFNLLAHVCCGFLLFCFCRKMDWAGRFRNGLAWIVALLFISYPFHNEAIVWVVGRGAGLAALFALACLLVVLYVPGNVRYFLACLFYFIGLTAYESIFPLPLMVILLDNRMRENRHNIIKWGVVFSGTLLCHLLLRISFSSAILGEYAGGILQKPLRTHVSNLFKIIGRMFLPPLENATLLLFLFVSIIMLLSMAVLWFIRKHQGSEKARKDLYLILAFVLLSLIVPVTFSVSTKTSESDRLLYFPSIFICLLIGYLIVGLFQQVRIRVLVATCVVLYYIYFLQLNNANWSKASAITGMIISKAKTLAATEKQVLLLNIPNEFNGAFIFRNGFKDAMMLYGIRNDQVRSLNILTRSQSDSLPEIIAPIHKSNEIWIPPHSLVYSDRFGNTFLRVSDSITRVNRLEHDIWYWNKKTLVRFDQF